MSINPIAWEYAKYVEELHREGETVLDAIEISKAIYEAEENNIREVRKYEGTGNKKIER